jgi:hypothetical protein
VPHIRLVACGAGWVFSRLFVPRSVRRAMHPGRTVKRAVTTAIRSGGKRKAPAPVFHHGNCPVRHRSAEAAAGCRDS